jgi:hypothetical protein
MSKKMSVTIDVVRSITEIWYFDIKDDANPESIFQDIKNNPNILWTKFDSNMDFSEDFDEMVSQVVGYEVE